MAGIGPPWSEMVKYRPQHGRHQVAHSDRQRGRPARIQHPERHRCAVPSQRPARDGRRVGVPGARVPERKVRAYDRDNGKELWVRDLPNGSEGMPATYEVNGRQFVVFPVASATGTFPATFGARGGRGGGGAERQVLRRRLPAAGGAPPAAAPASCSCGGAAAPAPGAAPRGGSGTGGVAVEAVVAAAGGVVRRQCPGAYIAFALPQK